MEVPPIYAPTPLRPGVSAFPGNSPTYSIVPLFVVLFCSAGGGFDKARFDCSTNPYSVNVTDLDPFTNIVGVLVTA